MSANQISQTTVDKINQRTNQLYPYWVDASGTFTMIDGQVFELLTNRYSETWILTTGEENDEGMLIDTANVDASYFIKA